MDLGEKVEVLKDEFSKRWNRAGVDNTCLTRKGAKAYSGSERAYFAMFSLNSDQYSALLSIEDDRRFYNVVRDIMRRVKENGVEKADDDMITEALGENK